MTHSKSRSARKRPAFGKYLSPAGLEQLKAYKYVSAPLVSVVDQKMTYFWEWAVTLLPMWLAPNLVTTFSFMHAVLAHFLIQYYTPNLNEAAPRWAYFLVACCMFLYQTLDAIDGKQARRTKNGSPLGQLFDHGCDAMTAWIMGIFMAATFQCGPTVASFIVEMMVVVPFFAANWEESCTSVFRFGVVGVTEGQFIVMGILVMTSIIGPEFWVSKVFPDLLGVKGVLPHFEVFHAIILGGLIGVAYQVITSLIEVRKYYQQHRGESRRQAIVSFTQFFLGIALSTAWVFAPSNAMIHHPRLILVIVGALCSYQASRLIICHTTGERYSNWFAVMCPLPLVVLNEWSGRLFHASDDQLWLDQTYVIWAYFLIIAVLYVHFVTVTIHQITTFLGIHCFKIKPHPYVAQPPILADPLSTNEKAPTIIKKVFGKAR